MLQEFIRRNREDAFRHFVKAIKKQSTETIEFEDGIYTYKTKTGKVKVYRYYDSFKKYADSEHYPDKKPERVNGFIFVEI